MTLQVIAGEKYQHAQQHRTEFDGHRIQSYHQTKTVTTDDYRIINLLWAFIWEKANAIIEE